MGKLRGNWRNGFCPYHGCSLQHLRPVSITAARCVASLTIARHATQHAAVMETALKSCDFKSGPHCLEVDKKSPTTTFCRQRHFGAVNFEASVNEPI